MDDDMVDVLIAGAGPVGLALAADLARWGVSFRIVDRKAGPERHSKAANFWPRTAEVANAIGFLDPVRAVGVDITGVTVHAFGSYIGHPVEAPHPRPSPYGGGYAVNQGQVEQILVDHVRASGADIDYGAAVVGLVQHGDHVAVDLDRAGARSTVRARYVVGCDGARSAVREHAGLPIEPVDLPDRSLQQIDARLRWSRGTGHDVIDFFLYDDGFCGVVPLPGGYHRVFICRSAADVPERPPTAEEATAALREIARDPLVELTDVAWTSWGRFRYGVADRYRDRRVFVAGDAGHMTIPVGGQGMNNGIQDAFNLGWKLAAVLQRRSPEALLDSYDAERRPVRADLAQAQRDNFDRLMHPSRFEKLKTRWIGPWAMKRQSSVELGNRDDTQLSVAYPTGPLSEDHLGRRGIVAGWRALDAPVAALPDLRSSRLYDLLYAGPWTLLAFDAARPGAAGPLQSAVERLTVRHPQLTGRVVVADPAVPGRLGADDPVLLDIDRFAHARWEITRPSLFAVRPDGHVGFRGALRHLPQLEAYLDRVLVPGAPAPATASLRATAAVAT